MNQLQVLKHKQVNENLRNRWVEPQMIDSCFCSSSGRDFPSCPEGSEVSRCTAAMDAVAFNAFTEFFTHTHAICHFLYSEALQRRAQNTMDR